MYRKFIYQKRFYTLNNNNTDIDSMGSTIGVEESKKKSQKIIQSTVLIVPPLTYALGFITAQNTFFPPFVIYSMLFTTFFAVGYADRFLFVPNTQKYSLRNYNSRSYTVLKSIYNFQGSSNDMKELELKKLMDRRFRRRYKIISRQRNKGYLLMGFGMLTCFNIMSQLLSNTLFIVPSYLLVMTLYFMTRTHVIVDSSYQDLSRLYSYPPKLFFSDSKCDNNGGSNNTQHAEHYKRGVIHPFEIAKEVGFSVYFHFLYNCCVIGAIALIIISFLVGWDLKTFYKSNWQFKVNEQENIKALQR